MIDVAEFESPTQEDIQIDLAAMFRAAAKVVLETALEEEMRAIIGAAKWARLGSARADVRNGTYLRKTLTAMGTIEIAVPRSRENGAATGTLGRYQRRAGEIDDAITAAYVNGVSTRKMGRVTEALLGERVERSTVSRVTKVLEQEVEALRRQPITEAFPYLLLDGTFLDARWARKVENVAALVAYGVNEKGQRRLLAVTIGIQESEESWADLLRQLVDRGLRGVELVIADAHGGLAAAVRHQLPEAKLQRCIVHLQRNVFAKAPHRLRKRLANEVSEVFRAPSLAEAKKRFESLKNRFAKIVPEALSVLEAGFAASTQYYAFPKEHWLRIRSTNGLERLHGEIKRRTRAVGAFPDRTSALRLITAVAIRATAIWTDRRYLDMSHRKSEVLTKAA